MTGTLQPEGVVILFHLFTIAMYTASGTNQGQNNSGEHGSSNHSHQSRKPPGMEGKCMRCGKPEDQSGQKCPAKNAKCKKCHKIGHFHKVCQSKKRGKRANLVQTAPNDEDDTHINENGVRQPNPPRVNMLKIVNHIGDNRGPQGKHLKFPIATHPKGLYVMTDNISCPTNSSLEVKLNARLTV